MVLFAVVFVQEFAKRLKQCHEFLQAVAGPETSAVAASATRDGVGRVPGVGVPPRRAIVGASLVFVVSVDPAPNCVSWDNAGAYLRFSATYLAKEQREEDALMAETVNRLG
jgi:hypothetical protein